MVKTEMLPRCSRVISASSDITHLHCWPLRRAPCLLIPSNLLHDLLFASHARELNDDSHFTRLVPAACRPEARFAGPISGNTSGASAPVHRRRGLLAAARPEA